MEFIFPPTATPEELESHCKNCKIILKGWVLQCSEKEGGEEAFERPVSTWIWCQINERGNASSKQNNVPKSAGDKERQIAFNCKKTLKEISKCKDRQEKGAQHMALMSN